MTTGPSVVTLTWKRDPEDLHGLLRTLHAQTLRPAEVVVVDMTPAAHAAMRQRVTDLCEEFPLARRVDAPRDKFSLSWGMNVGIRATDGGSRWVMTTGCEMLFAPNVLECLMGRIEPGCMGLSKCGFLKEGVDARGDVHARWGELLGQIHPNPPTKVSSGTLILAERAWWHKVRGYDEKNHPFNYADADVVMRGKLDGLCRVVCPWTEAQVLHPWHEKPREYWTVGSALPHEKRGIVRNPGGWGEL